jgi:hypothetical protein
VPNGKLFLAGLVGSLAFSSHGHATSLFLMSQGGGTYEYQLEVDSNTDVAFGNGATIELTGLSGVTGASVLTGNPDNLSSCFDGTTPIVTPTSVTFTAGTCSPIQGGAGSPQDYGTLQVTSSITTPGTVDYSLDTSNGGTLTGTAQGPVGSAVPEPATWSTAVLALLCGGAMRCLFKIPMAFGKLGQP